jgi:hypothetical protein
MQAAITPLLRSFLVKKGRRMAVDKVNKGLRRYNRLHAGSAPDPVMPDCIQASVQLRKLSGQSGIK